MGLAIGTRPTRRRSSHAAELSDVPIRGRIVIGEGERDEAPMLYIGEKVGRGGMAVDIAVDPLEGTNLCATGSPNALAVLAASEPGGLLHAPDIYMQKLVVGPSCKGAVELDAPVKDNLKAIAKRLDRDIEDLVVVVLDRPRHESLIEEIRAAGARIRLISDGDVAPAIAVAVLGSGVHAVMGVGGAPERAGSSALRCLNGEILARLVRPSLSTKSAWPRWASATPSASTDRGAGAGQEDRLCLHRVTPGDLLRGVRFFGEGRAPIRC
jgi:fructose-1,6-bisphosphatase class II